VSDDKTNLYFMKAESVKTIARDSHVLVGFCLLRVTDFLVSVRRNVAREIGHDQSNLPTALCGHDRLWKPGGRIQLLRDRSAWTKSE